MLRDGVGTFGLEMGAQGTDKTSEIAPFSTDGYLKVTGVA